MPEGTIYIWTGTGLKELFAACPVHTTDPAARGDLLQLWWIIWICTLLINQLFQFINNLNNLNVEAVAAQRVYTFPILSQDQILSNHLLSFSVRAEEGTMSRLYTFSISCLAASQISVCLRSCPLKRFASVRFFSVVLHWNYKQNKCFSD